MSPSPSMEIVALVLVGLLWGCTNPLIRRGSLECKNVSSSTDGSVGGNGGNNDDSSRQTFLSSFQYVQKFRNVRVWLPYALNQAGSILYYVALSQTDLSLAVPLANALALVFSVATSVYLGEQLNRPGQTIFGAALVVGGVALCTWESAHTTDATSHLQ